MNFFQYFLSACVRSLHENVQYGFAFRPALSSFLAEIGQSQTGGGLIFSLVAHAGDDQYQHSERIGKHFQNRGSGGC